MAKSTCVDIQSEHSIQVVLLKYLLTQVDTFFLW